ncbi:dihydroorotate dehydrogenase [Ureibacillus chungkukjangi]|uniref:dihydroorotate dehydrogenase n=1 Tax=Ureibacillus chungkukjangi TaxID=1202712 RepID=UPI00203FAE66|nr:dihydroorotate dehydrogenase [Ureibacillus chungkukjangi]MCM3388815.1 dihydroorotate dehydrogenase [Ureibacillus chungkukjangi]
MPDWSYHPLKEVLLDKVSARVGREFIHQSMSTVAKVPGGRSFIGFLGHMNPPHQLQKDIFQTRFSTSVGLSGVIDPKLSGLRAFQELGFGFVEIGPIVINEPHEQKEPLRENRQILFANQPEKVPLKLVIQKLTLLNIRIPVLAKIDAQVNSQELISVVQHLTPFVAGFIGTSEQLHFIDQDLARPFYVSFTAEEFNENILDELVVRSCFAGVVLTAPRQIADNYWLETANANESLVKIVKQAKEVNPELNIITSGGVETPNEAYRLVEAGSDLVMLTSGYVRAGPGLPKRINERILFEERPLQKPRWAWSLLFGLSILMGGLIALYFALTSIILPYDESFIGLTKEEILLVNPRILAFMSHDRMALAGTMISAGILYIQLARHGIKLGMHWAKVTFHSAAIIGFLGILLFIGYGYFDWLHGLFWLILLPIYFFSFKEGKRVTSSPFSSHGENNTAWRIGLYGQLLFIILGFSILVGGIVISTIGVSAVFVSTDISFLCMSPEMLDSISSKLIPVIAHDRAGFGSALVSVGLLVLMLSLWGFRQGESWVWNTLAIGALPAFAAGIGTHFYIGYTNFLHLLPVYFLVVLYLVGLGLSYGFLKSKK